VLRNKENNKKKAKQEGEEERRSINIKSRCQRRSNRNRGKE
jgi:hypothetical protein